MTPAARSKNEAPTLVWYLAYGSNMLAAKFTGRRGIKPQRAVNVRVPGWVLSLDIPGMPYREPTFLSLAKRDDLPPDPVIAGSDAGEQRRTPHTRLSHSAKENQQTEQDPPDAVGVAYLITERQYAKVIASEGGGIAYADTQLQALSVSEHAPQEYLQIRTLVSVLRREPWPKPSKRYMNIVLDGAAEAKLPCDYQLHLQNIDTYDLPQKTITRVAAAIFAGFWGPIMGIMEKITHATTGEDGYCPQLVIWMVRFTMISIWLTHDVFFAPLVGSGDGYGAVVSKTGDEEMPLLKKQVTGLVPS